MTEANIINSYGPRQLNFNKGKGVWLIDNDNEQWFDALSGIGVNALGHCHPTLSAALASQAQELMHISNLYLSDIQAEAAKLICEKANMRQLFFSNSGTEANEAALKIARLFGRKKRGQSGKVITFSGSFHGRTLGALSATSKAQIKAPFSPMFDNIIECEFGDTKAVEQVFDCHQDIDAILVEPIQGEAGVRPAPAGFLSDLSTLCRQHDALFMLDEVQTGNGRTGLWYAHQAHDCKPDVMSTAKGLGGGFPVGATLIDGKALNILGPGDHGSTFGGNPMAARAAYTTLKTIDTENLLDNVLKSEQRIRSMLSALLGDRLERIDGAGLMLGIQLKDDVDELTNRLIAEKILVNVVKPSRIRLLPPLILSDEETTILCHKIANAILKDDK